MDDQQAGEVHQAVNAYLRDNPGLNLLNPKHFPELVNEIHALVSFTGDTEPTESFQDIVAMCAVGPDHCPPPKRIRSEFLKTMKTHSVGGMDRVLEIAVAYGCGKWRKAKPQGEPWEQQWSRALRILIQGMEPAVRQANEWLSKCVVGYYPIEHWKSSQGREAVQHDATLLALYIIESLAPLHIKHDQTICITCYDDHTLIEVVAGEYSQYLQPGARALIELNESALLQKVPDRNNKGERALDSGTQINVLARDDETEIKFSGPPKQVSLRIGERAELSGPIELSIWQCCCGNKNCANRHRLDSWIPSEKVNLWSFLASAVKGPDAKFKVNTFAIGMYYPLLVKEGMV